MAGTWEASLATSPRLPAREYINYDINVNCRQNVNSHCPKCGPLRIKYVSPDLTYLGAYPPDWFGVCWPSLQVGQLQTRCWHSLLTCTSLSAIINSNNTGSNPQPQDLGHEEKTHMKKKTEEETACKRPDQVVVEFPDQRQSQSSIVEGITEHHYLIKREEENYNWLSYIHMHREKADKRDGALWSSPINAQLVVANFNSRRDNTRRSEPTN